MFDRSKRAETNNLPETKHKRHRKRDPQKQQKEKTQKPNQRENTETENPRNDRNTGSKHRSRNETQKQKTPETTENITAHSHRFSNQCSPHDLVSVLRPSSGPSGGRPARELWRSGGFPRFGALAMRRASSFPDLGGAAGPPGRWSSGGHSAGEPWRSGGFPRLGASVMRRASRTSGRRSLGDPAGFLVSAPRWMTRTTREVRRWTSCRCLWPAPSSTSGRRSAWRTLRPAACCRCRRGPDLPGATRRRCSPERLKV